MKLFDPGFSPDDVLAHPRHHTTQVALAELITQLRACRTVNDGYELQQELLARLLGVEADRNAFSQAVKRMRRGKSPQAGAPEPQSGRDPDGLETWQFEREMCERIGRQYRCVGDALAWRVFGFERRYILALCRNEPAGVMAGKAGLEAERSLVQSAREAGRFAIMHDLTNCLRIGDVTVFGDGEPDTIEVKADPRRRRPQQLRRISAAEQALRRAGPLPGDDPKQRLHDLDVTFKTHLDLLQIATRQAALRGIFVAKVAGNRLLLVTDLYGCQARGWTEAEFGARAGRRLAAARRRAGLDKDWAWNIHATSLDSVSRDPLRVPFAAYPLHPLACASLIGDTAVFMVETSGPALAQAIRAAGINARWVRAPKAGELTQGEVLMEMTSTSGVPLPGQIVMEL